MKPILTINELIDYLDKKYNYQNNLLNFKVSDEIHKYICLRNTLMLYKEEEQLFYLHYFIEQDYELSLRTYKIGKIINKIKENRK